MVKLHFKKLYVRHQEGRIENAIIIYGKRGWTAQACNHGDKGHEVVIEYKKKLLIDLFFVVVDLEWIGKGDSCPNLKTTNQVSV
jgi:hypothetical protein